MSLEPRTIRAPERGPVKVYTVMDFDVDGHEWRWYIEASGPTLERATKYLNDLVCLVCSDPDHWT